MNKSWLSALHATAAIIAVAHVPTGTAAPLAAKSQVVQANLPTTGLPNILIIGLGGTITATSDGRANFQTYAKPTVPLAEIVARLGPEVARLANVASMELSNVTSLVMGVKDAHAMTQVIDAALDKDYDAVIVTTGTNIMEELAYWSDLTVRSPKPVIFTGSMRQSNTMSFDGEANLFNAIRLAASGKTYCYGTVLLMNDEFSAAREATKTDAVRLDAFKGGRYGALGAIDENIVRLVHAPARLSRCGQPSWQTPFDLSRITPDKIAKVEIVFSYMEADRTPIDALAQAGVRGIVTAGHGAGSISVNQSAARTEAIEKFGTIFVATTRTGSGALYDKPSPPKNVIAGNDLTPQKARILLQLALSFSQDPEQIRVWFNAIGWQNFEAASVPEQV